MSSSLTCHCPQLIVASGVALLDICSDVCLFEAVGDKTGLIGNSIEVVELEHFVIEFCSDEKEGVLFLVFLLRCQIDDCKDILA